MLNIFSVFPLMVSLFWSVIYILDWRTSGGPRHYLAACLFDSTLLYLCHAQFFIHGGALHPIYETIYNFCNISVFPLYYLYICRLTERKVPLIKKIAVIVPAAVLTIWVSILFIGFPGDEGAYRFERTVARTVFLLELIFVFIFGLRRFRLFNYEVENFYSSPEIHTLKPTKNLMFVLIGGAFISGIVNIIGRTYFSTHSEYLMIPSVIFGTLIFVMGYVGIKQVFSVDKLTHDEEVFADVAESNREPGSPDNAEPAAAEGDAGECDKYEKELLAKLEELMTVKEMFLLPELRLSDVAEEMRLSKNALSSLVNSSLGVSFSDFVNRFRVERAKQIILEDKERGRQLSMVQISEKSGFANDRALFRAFKKLQGMTPTQWLKMQKKD